MAAQIPEQVSNVGLQDWYASLSEMDRIKINKYIDKADPSSGFSLIVTLIRAAKERPNKTLKQFIKDLEALQKKYQ